MKKKDKLKSVAVTYFVVPFVILMIGFSVLTAFTVKNRVDEKHALLEQRTVEIANSYSHNLAHTTEAYDMITKLLDEKIRNVAQSVIRIPNKEDSSVLREIAQAFNVDEISVYDDRGEIISSTDDGLLGWQAYEGHPVYDFMMSNQTIRIEEVRQDSVNGLYYKFGYLKNPGSGFVQLGILAENMQEFLDEFEVARLVDEISRRKDVKNVFFVDPTFQVLASNLSEYSGAVIHDVALQNKLLSEKARVEQVEMNGTALFRVSVPIYSDFVRLGTLVIDWPTDNLDKQVSEIIHFGIGVLVAILLTIGGILFYAYRKNKENIKIAYYDEVTGLRNTRYLHDYLEGLIAVPRKQNKELLLLHFSNLRTVNMTYGFAYGDELLKQITDKIRQVLKTDETFFRYDGNRFVIIMDNSEQKESARYLAEKVIRLFDAPIVQGTEKQFVEVQIAIVNLLERHDTTDKVLQDATLTLTYIKDSAVLPLAFFDEKMVEVLLRKEKLVKVLRDVISGKDTTSFYLEYQPKIDLSTNRVMGFEALARLRTDPLGQIPPDEFIALAEEKLLINELGNHILKLAIDFLARMQKQGLSDVTLAVNISGIQLLREDFVEALRAAPYLTDEILQSLEFEITESVLLEHHNQINDILEEIKRLGISVSLDDFGTGFSSLSSIGELHIDTVKIDRFFINRISHLPDKDLITSDIISMAHKIGLQVVAEGVEDERQKTYLEHYGCDIIQGYLVSRPLPELKTLSFLEDYNGMSQVQVKE